MENETIYDVAILGGGPAGCAAAVYAARKGITVALITESFGGQSIVSETIYNWIGTPEISGHDLAESLKNHVLYYPTITVISGERITKVSDEGTLTIETNKNKYAAKTILYTLGSSRRKLTAKGADIFEHKGLTYCASCDGPLFSGMDVAVVGGGNAGFESALQLLSYCKSVTLFHKYDTFKADETTVAKALAHPKFKAVTSSTILEITGDNFVNGIVYNTATNPTPTTLLVSGIFAEVGGIPNTTPLQEIVDLTETGFVKVDPRTQKTSHAKIWAAGDCTDGLYHQNNIAAGDAVKALEDLYLSL